MISTRVSEQQCALRQEAGPSGQGSLWDIFNRAVREAALAPMDGLEAHARMVEGLKRYGAANHLGCNFGQEIREEALDIFNLCVLREDAWELYDDELDWAALGCLKRVVPVLLTLAASLDAAVAPEGE